MDKLKEIIKNFPKGNKKSHLLLIIGILGILLIAFSEVGVKKSSAAETVSKIDDTVYCKELEDKIKELVSAITGNSDCIVGVTLENGSEYIYADQNTLDTDQTEDKGTDAVTTKESHKQKQEYIIIEGENGEQNALIITEKKPGVRGVAIVASGINNMNYDLILSSVSSMLGIPTRKISLAEAG